MILLAVLVGLGYHTVAFALLVLFMSGLLAVRTLAKREEGSGPELFALLMLGVALALGIGVEFLKVNLVDPGRMNTVFKFYFHAWTLMALASAYFAWRLGLMAIPRKLMVRRVAWTQVLIILVVAGSYIPSPLPQRAKHRFNDSPTSTEWPTARRRIPQRADRNATIEPPEVRKWGWDYQASSGSDNLKGSPSYWRATRGCTLGKPGVGYTGLPTIVGWDWHQQQQRWEDRDEVSVRRADVRAIYSTFDIETAKRLLKKYGVSYIYVGQLERLYYPQTGIEKFEQMAREGLIQTVYPTPNSRTRRSGIYRVMF